MLRPPKIFHCCNRSRRRLSSGGEVFRIGWWRSNLLASAFGEFGKLNRQSFHPYLNFHRPWGVPTLVERDKGKRVRSNPWYATPWEILRHLPDLASCLKERLTIAELDREARRGSDLEAARRMQKAKAQLFEEIRKRSHEIGEAVEMPGVRSPESIRHESR